MVAMVPRVVAKVFAMQLLRYPGWLLGCCYAVAMVPGVVARVLLRVARGSWSVARVCYAVAREPGVVARVLLCGC